MSTVYIIISLIDKFRIIFFFSPKISNGIIQTKISIGLNYLPVGWRLYFCTLIPSVDLTVSLQATEVS